MSTKDLLCPRCLKPSSEVGKIHEYYGLCIKCVREWIAQNEADVGL